MQMQLSSPSLGKDIGKENDSGDISDTKPHMQHDSTPMPIVSNRMEIRYPRPLPSDVVATVAQSDNPGAFFCGPIPLRNTIKKAIIKERRKVQGCLYSPCAIYDEESEM